MALVFCPLGSDPAAADALSDAKGDLQNRGVTPSLQYQGAGVANVAGGARRGGTYVGAVQLQLLLEGGPLIGVPGLSVDVNAVDIHGGQPSGFAGDAQGVSNIAGPPGFRLYEAWLQYNLLGENLSLLAGQYDLNTEFYFLQSASVLLNSSFGQGPEFALTGIGGPSSYPDTALGARLALRAADGVLLQAAILDGAPVRRPDGTRAVFKSGDGALLTAELAYFEALGAESSSNKKKPTTTVPIGRVAKDITIVYDGKIALGGWYYTRRFDDLSEIDTNGQPVRRRGSGGAYLIAEQTLYPTAGNSSHGLAAFLELGVGDRRVNRFDAYLGGGLVATDLVRLRDDDQLALAVAVARNGAHYMRAQRDQDIPTRRNEIALELTYLAPLNDWLKLQPDVQYIIHPDTDPARRNALVFQLQMTLTF